MTDGNLTPDELPFFATFDGLIVGRGTRYGRFNFDAAALVDVQEAVSLIGGALGTLPSGYAEQYVLATEGQSVFASPAYPTSQPTTVEVFINGGKVRFGPTGWFVPAAFVGVEAATQIQLAFGVAAGTEVDIRVMPFTRAEIPALFGNLEMGGFRVTELAAPSARELTVGAGGDYATVNAAILGALAWLPMGTVTIRLLAGFVMNEQVIAVNQNLSAITIVSNASVVTVNPAGITQTLVAIDNARPIFGAIGVGAALPRIGALFAYVDNATAWDGVAVYGGAICEILPECGVQRCRRGIQAYNGGRVVCNIDGLRSSAGEATTQLGVDFRECSGRALDVQQGSTATLPRSNFNDCGGDNAVYFIWGSSGNIYQSDVRRAAGTAILCRDASSLCARECNMDAAGDRAVHALHGGLIDARGKMGGSVNGFGIHAAKNCLGAIAVLASAGSMIDAAEIAADGAAGRGFSASEASTINAALSSATNCGSYGYLAEKGSSINANESTASGCGVGYSAQGGSMMNARDCVANNCSTFGFLSFDASSLNAESSQANSCDVGIEVREGSTINARSATANASVNRAFSVIDGGEINIQSAVSTGSLDFDLTVRAGGRVAARFYNGDIDLRDGGGIVHNEGGTGAVSQATNTLAANGIIFR